MTPDGPGFNGPSKPAMEQYSGSKSSAGFTDDQLAIRNLTRRFVRSEILPNILQWDEEEVVPVLVWKRIGELGLHGVCAPAEWGGSDSGIVAWAMMVEELAYGDCAIANQVGGISFPYVAKLLQFGTDQQKENFLRPVVEDFIDEMAHQIAVIQLRPCLLYTSPSPRDGLLSRMPSSA